MKFFYILKPPGFQILMFVFLFLLVSSTFYCKDDDMDPCDIEGIEPISAAFTTSHNLGFQDSIRRIESDTFVTGRNIIFSAKQNGLSYKWIIGSDARVFEEKEFSLRFDNVAGENVPIQLIVEGEPDLECFPEDDGRDTLFREIHFVDANECPIFGMYRGVMGSMPNDTFIIDIQYILPDGDTNIDNLPNGCIREDFDKVSFLVTYRDFHIEQLGNYAECPKPQGWGYVDPNGNISIDYRIYNHDIDMIVSDLFTGIKIQ